MNAVVSIQRQTQVGNLPPGMRAKVTSLDTFIYIAPISRVTRRFEKQDGSTYIIKIIAEYEPVQHRALVSAAVCLAVTSLGHGYIASLESLST